MEKQDVLTVFLPAELKRKLRLLAVRERKTLSQIVREILASHLKPAKGKEG